MTFGKLGSRGGFGSLGVLGTTWPLPISGFTLNADGYLVSNADSSLWVFDIDSDGVFVIDATSGAYLIEAA